jgi:ZIP family zinc transporter
MDDYLKVLGLALLPAGGNFVGGVLAETFNVSARALSIALHAAAGIVLAVIGIELMPEALEATQPWVVVLAFLGGGIFALGADRVIEHVQERFARPEPVPDGTRAAAGASAAGAARPASGAAWAIFFGVAVDLFSDGVMIGTGSTISFSLALLLALAQVPADVPEGFATIATFKRQGVPRARRLLLSASFTIPILLGATIGYWGVREAAEVVKLSLLAFTAGILLTVVIEEMVPEAHREGDSRLAALALVGGFALFAVISAYAEVG